MTAKQLINELQLHMVRHPEAADLPVNFIGCYDDEDGDGNLINTAGEKTVARVVLDLRNKRFIVED